MVVAIANWWFQLINAVRWPLAPTALGVEGLARRFLVPKGTRFLGAEVREERIVVLIVALMDPLLPFVQIDGSLVVKAFFLRRKGNSMANNTQITRSIFPQLKWFSLRSSLAAPVTRNGRKRPRGNRPLPGSGSGLMPGYRKNLPSNISAFG